MESRKCRVCFQSTDSTLLTAKDYFLGSKKKYDYILCSGCNSLSIEKIPEDLDQLYENYYSFSPPNKVSKVILWIYKYILKKSNLLSKFFCLLLKNQNDLPIQSFQPIKLHTNSRILDVGCGSGTLLCLMHDMGFKNCIGIDPFLEKDINYSNGLKIKKQSFFDLNEKFDVIMFHHVFEHFPNPKEVLNHLDSLLAENGVCIIRIPNVDSYSFLRYKENWFSIHAPFHLFLPSKKGMEMIVQEAGLVIDKTLGEQLIEFFFYSIGHELGVCDYEKNGNRKFIEKYGIHKIPPLHIKNEIKEAKQRRKQVRKHDLCDWAVYYLKKNELYDTSDKQN